jgi:hypothetical protein
MKRITWFSAGEFALGSIICGLAAMGLKEIYSWILR